MLTPVAEAKASSHDPIVSLDLVHSLNSAIIGYDTLVVTELAFLSFSGVERHRWMNSAVKGQLCCEGTDKRSSPEIHILMDLVALFFRSIMYSTDSLASTVRPATKRASHNCCRIVVAKLSNFHPRIC